MCPLRHLESSSRTIDEDRGRIIWRRNRYCYINRSNMPILAGPKATARAPGTATKLVMIQTPTNCPKDTPDHTPMMQHTLRINAQHPAFCCSNNLHGPISNEMFLDDRALARNCGTRITQRRACRWRSDSDGRGGPRHPRQLTWQIVRRVNPSDHSQARRSREDQGPD